VAGGWDAGVEAGGVVAGGGGGGVVVGRVLLGTAGVGRVLLGTAGVALGGGATGLPPVGGTMTLLAAQRTSPM
jgi:hypothetical protein